MTPFVDILILNYNGWRDTIECLESVLRMDYPSYRIVLCDNGSSDDSLEHIRRWANGDLAPERRPGMARVIEGCVSPPLPKPIPLAEVGISSPADVAQSRLVLFPVGHNGGFAAGNNAGIRLSQADGRAAYLWLLNNDTVVAPDALSQLVGVAERDPRIGVVGGTMLHYGAADRVQFGAGGVVRLATGAVTRINQQDVPRSNIDPASDDFNFVCGGCLLVRVGTLDAAGLLDERFFMYAEDSDLCLRITSRGFTLAYAADAYVWHKGGASSIVGSPFNDYQNVRSSLLLVHKWRPRHVPLALAYWMYRAVAPKIWRRQWPRLAAVLRAYRDAIRDMQSV